MPDIDNRIENANVVMIDLFRASSTIVTAIANRAKEIIPCESIEKAARIYGNMSKENRLLGGERNNTKPDGFDLGNSPLEYTAEILTGKTLVYATTNGTKIFEKGKYSLKRYIGSFLNFTSVVNKLVEEENKEKIVFFCAGSNGNFSFEDFYCAGAFIYELSERLYFEKINYTDTAKAAKLIYTANKDLEILKDTIHGNTLIGMGLENDINECISKDKYNFVPEIIGTSIKPS